MKKIPMTQEDRDYFKSGVRTLFGDIIDQMYPQTK